MRTDIFILHTIRPFTRYILASLIGVIAAAIARIASPVVIGKLIDAAGNTESALLFLAVIILCLELLNIVGWRLVDWGSMMYEVSMRSMITQRNFAQLMRQPYEFLQRHFSGSLIAQSADLIVVPKIVHILLGDVLFNFLTAIFAAAAAFQIHPTLGISLVLWILFFVFISVLGTGRIKRSARASAAATTKVNGRIIDAVTNMLAVRLFNGPPQERAFISAAQAEHAKAHNSRRAAGLQLNLAQGLLFWGYQIFCLYTLVNLHKQGIASPGDFARMLGINVSLLSGVWKIGETFAKIADYWGGISNALATVYKEPTITDKLNAPSLHVTGGAVSFTDVHFAYENEALFKGLSIEIPAGQKVGLVGYSGSGKTTFVNLLLRLYDISTGKICIDGQNIAEVTQDSLHEAVAVVPQDPALFHRTIEENIAYGAPHSNHQEVIKAAQQAAAHTFITQLQADYHTLIGERGAKLSGGQRQRVALARALLKKAAILVLDEATSALDTITEREVQLSLEEWIKKHHHTYTQTTIVIAHRLSTLTYMDRLLVFDKGVIVQDGTHQELIKQPGLYQELWKIHADGGAL